MSFVQSPGLKRVEKAGGHPLLDDDPPVVVLVRVDHTPSPLAVDVAPPEEQRGEPAVARGDPAVLDVGRCVVGAGLAGLDAVRHGAVAAPFAHAACHEPRVSGAADKADG